MSAPLLLVGPAWVGDMVMTQALLRTLQAADPVRPLDVLAPAWSLPLLARMSEVRRAIPMPLGHGRLDLAVRYRLGRELRAEGYGEAIVLPRSLKAALIPFFARVPRRTGYRGEMRYGLINDMRPLDRTVLRQTVQRYVALGLPADAPLPPPIPEPALRIDADNQARLIDALGLETDRPVVAMMVGAEYGAAKRWPLEHFAAAAAKLAEAGCRIWLIGGEGDRAAAGQVAAAGEAVTNLCGRTELEDAVDLLALARAAVTNDSGLMHVAAAVGTPLVAIYGSSTPAYTPPLTPKAKVLYLGLECSPCFKRECPLGHTRCLRDIAPEAVTAAALEWLEEAA